MISIRKLDKESLLFKKNFLASVGCLLKKPQFILGEKVLKFEKQFARFNGSKYSVGVSSGTDAILAALMALGIREGDEVITTPLTAAGTILGIIMLKAVPVFVDIDPESFNIDVKKIKDKITRRTKLLIPVHLFGNPCDMESIISISRTCKIPVMEDCCQSHGAKYAGKRVGNFGVMGAFSFYPTKNLGSFGDSGCVVTNSVKYYKKLLQIRNQGQYTRYNHTIYGYNLRMDALQALILEQKLKYLNQWNNKRRKIARKYINELKDLPLTFQKKSDNAVSVYHQFSIITKNRDKLLKYLIQNRIEADIHYPKPLYKNAAFRKFKSVCINAEKITRNIISLPINPFLKEREIDYIIKKIKKFYN